MLTGSLCVHVLYAVQTSALSVANHMVLGLLGCQICPFHAAVAGTLGWHWAWGFPVDCSLCGDPCFACVTAIQAPKNPTDSICAAPLGFHLRKLQVLIHPVPIHSLHVCCQSVVLSVSVICPCVCLSVLLFYATLLFCPSAPLSLCFSIPPLPCCLSVPFSLCLPGCLPACSFVCHCLSE